MEDVSLSDAVKDLRDGELVFWLQLHEVRLPYRGTLTALAARLAGEKTRPTILSYCRALRAKGYASYEETHDGKKKISLKRRLHVAHGAYSRF